MGLDQELFRAINGAGTPLFDPVMIALGVVGLLYFAFLWAIPLWLGGRRRDAVDLVLLLGLDAILVFVLKRAFEVPRPSLAGMRYLAVPLDDVSDFAFPSGHATRAFAAALLLTLRTRDWRWGVPLYAYASLIALSRVYVGAHWPSDVIGGAILGTAWALVFARATKTAWYSSRRDRFIDWLARRRERPA